MRDAERGCIQFNPGERSGSMHRLSLAGRFRRITSGGRYVPEIDGIRFVAIFGVFFFHLAGDLLRHSEPGYGDSLHGDPVFWTTQVLSIGVQLFFVLSGYVLALPFARQYIESGRSVSWKQYLLRRLTRLEPPYIISLVLLFLFKIWAGRSSVVALGPHLAASLAYLHNLIYSQPSEVNFVAWSLEIEIQFYLLAPFLCFVFFRNRSVWQRRAILTFCCVGCGAIAGVWGSSPRVQLSLLGQLPYFLAGLLLADTATTTVRAQKISAKNCDLGCIGAVFLLFHWIELGWPLPYVGPLTVAASYWFAFRSRWILAFLRAGVVSAIGGMCYSIYLLHNYVIGFCGQFTEKVGPNLSFEARLLVQACLLGPIVLLVSGIFYTLIERPCMDSEWPSRFMARLGTFVGGANSWSEIRSEESQDDLSSPSSKSGLLGRLL